MIEWESTYRLRFILNFFIESEADQNVEFASESSCLASLSANMLAYARFQSPRS